MGKEKAALGHRGPCVKLLAWVYVDTDGIDGNLRSWLFNVWINENNRDGQQICAKKKKTEQKYPDWSSLVFLRSLMSVTKQNMSHMNQ